MDAEEVGEDGGRDLGGQLQQGGVAVGARIDAEGAQPLGKPGGVQVLAGAAAGEQPVAVMEPGGDAARAGRR